MSELKKWFFEYREMFVDREDADLEEMQATAHSLGITPEDEAEWTAMKAARPQPEF
jgi:hypothetical protein